MSSSSELSISSSMPVIFPARVGCKAWISGYSRSPVWDANSLVILLSYHMASEDLEYSTQSMNYLPLYTK